MNKYKYLLTACLLLISQTAGAFDEQRQGFILGFGAGLHETTLDFTYNGAKIDSESKGGLATSLKIGAGITNQLAVYYVRNASWYQAPISNGFETSDTLYTVGISGIGVTYYLSATAPSWYFLGAVGVGDISAPFDRDVKSDTGGAIMLGGGYEASKHVQLEATFLGTNIDSSDVSQLNLKSSSLQLTLNYLFY